MVQHMFQFDDVSLVAAIAIMEKSELGDQARGNSVFVLRALSRVVSIILNICVVIESFDQGKAIFIFVLRTLFYYRLGIV